MTRCLLSTTRTVQDAAGYHSAWQDLHALAQTLDARAWLFRDAWNPDRYIEFIEWQQAREGPLELDPGLAAAHRALDRFGAGNSEQWLEP